MEKVLKIGIVLIAILSVFPISKDLFEFTRFILIVLFGILAYSEHLNANVKQFGFFIAMIFVFQPFVPLPFNELIWNVVHVSLAVIVTGTLFMTKKITPQPIED